MEFCEVILAEGETHERAGRRLSELRRSGAAGIHGKTRPDRWNTEREAREEAMADTKETIAAADEDRDVEFDEDEYPYGGLVEWPLT